MRWVRVYLWKSAEADEDVADIIEEVKAPSAVAAIKAVMMNHRLFSAHAALVRVPGRADLEEWRYQLRLVLTSA